MGELVSWCDRVGGRRAGRREGHAGLERVQAVLWRVSRSGIVKDHEADGSDTGYRYASAPEGDEDAICPAFQRKSPLPLLQLHRHTRQHHSALCTFTRHLLTSRNRRLVRPDDPLPPSSLHGLIPPFPPEHLLHLSRPIHLDFVATLFPRRCARAPSYHEK